MRNAYGFPFCKPIPYEGTEACTVEFANTPGGLIATWIIKFDDGRVRTGICEPGGAKTFYSEPGDPLEDLDDDVLTPCNIHDSRALKATWPLWESMRGKLPGSV